MPKVSNSFKNTKTCVYYIKIEVQYFGGEREVPQSMSFINHDRMSQGMLQHINFRALH